MEWSKVLRAVYRGVKHEGTLFALGLAALAVALSVSGEGRVRVEVRTATATSTPAAEVGPLVRALRERGVTWTHSHAQAGPGWDFCDPTCPLYVDLTPEREQ